MKFIKLLGHARVNGALRSPADGVLHLENDEAQRLIDNELGVDVSEDFSADDHENVPVEHLDNADSLTEASLAMEPHDIQPSVVTPLTLADPETETEAEDASASKE